MKKFLFFLFFISTFIFSQNQIFMPEECFKLTINIITPHIPWAKPYYKKKLTALVLGPRYSQRETIELMERMEINAIPVLLYDKRNLWQEGWNWGFEKVKEFSKDYCIKELSDGVNRSYDVIIIGQAPLQKFPKEIIEKIKTKIYSGVGLVYFYENPYGGSKPWNGFKELTEKPTDEEKEFLTTGIPFEELTGFGGRRLKTKDKIDLTKLFNCYTYGEGRIVMINYPKFGEHFITPSDTEDINYEYYMSFVIKSILWAGKNVPEIIFSELPEKIVFSVNQTPPEMNFKILNKGKQTKVKIILSARTSKKLYKLPDTPFPNFGVHQTEPLLKPVYKEEKELLLPEGEAKIAFKVPELACGKYFFDIEILSENKKVNWATIPVEIQKYGSVIAKIKIIPEAIDLKKSDEINVKVILLEPLKEQAKMNLSLIDNYNRILSKKEINLNKGEILIETKLSIADISTTLGRVRGELYINDKLVSIETEEFTVFNRPWDDFTFFAWGGSTEGYISRQRTRISVEYGIDAFRRPGSYELLETADFRISPDLWRLGSKVVDKKYVQPCFNDPEFKSKMASKLKEMFEKNRPFDPFGFLHGDEFGFIRGGLPGGCNCDNCVKGFRKFLKNKYKNIENLNKQWETHYKSFEEIMPLDEERRKNLMEKAKETKNYSYLINQWLFNYFSFTDFFRFVDEKLKELGPEGNVKIGCSTPLWNWYYRGYDWSEIMKYINYFTPYGPWGDIEQREAGRSFAKEGTILSAHYGSYVGDGQIVDLGRQKITPYVLLFNKCSNAFWYHLGYGGETGISPSLEPYPCFKVNSEQIQKLKNGLARLILPAKIVNNNIAIYWSTPSYLFSFLVSGPSVPWRLNTIIYALEELGYQYDFVSPVQVKNGILDNYKVFILPITQCIEKDESEKIKEFVKNGGIVIADVKTGNFDENGKIWKESLLSELFGVKSKDPLQPVGNINAQFIGEYKGISFSGPIIEKVAVDTSIVVTDGKSVLNIEGVPLIIYKDYGKGSAIFLNTTHADGDITINNNFRNILGVILSAHNIEQNLKIKAEIKDFSPGNFIPGLEYTHFKDGNAEYFGITRRKVKNAGDEIKGFLTIDFLKKGHLYDVLEGKYLGEKDKIEIEISPYDVYLYALLPYKLKGIEIKGLKEIYNTGDIIEGEIELNIKENPCRHVINLQIKRPDGKIVRYLRKNFETNTRRANFRIPICLNEMEGKWELIFTDVATGITKSVFVSVKSGGKK